MKAHITHNITARDVGGDIVRLDKGAEVSVLGDVTRPGDREPISEVLLLGKATVVAARTGGCEVGATFTLSRPVWIPTRALAVDRAR